MWPDKNIFPLYQFIQTRDAEYELSLVLGRNNYNSNKAEYDADTR